MNKRWFNCVNNQDCWLPQFSHKGYLELHAFVEQSLNWSLVDKLRSYFGGKPTLTMVRQYSNYPSAYYQGFHVAILWWWDELWILIIGFQVSLSSIYGYCHGKSQLYLQNPNPCRRSSWQYQEHNSVSHDLGNANVMNNLMKSHWWQSLWEYNENWSNYLVLVTCSLARFGTTLYALSLLWSHLLIRHLYLCGIWLALALRWTTKKDVFQWDWTVVTLETPF